MTKKDFIVVAKTLRRAIWALRGHEQEQKTIVITARFFAEEFAVINPRFDRQKFYEACGLSGNDD